VLADRPKPLAPVGGRPFIVRLLEQVARAGWSQAVLCTGHMAEAVEEALGEAQAGLPLVYSREPEPLGTGGALRLALPLLESDPVLVLNGDSWAEVDLAVLADEHRRRGAPATLALVEVADAARFGRVRLGADGAVERFEEKAAAHLPGLINAGIYLLSRRLIEAIPAGRPVSLEREVFPSLVGRGLSGVVFPGRFIDIGTPESLAEAESFFREADA
jgi:NDP-sugar pyrophosphorylase family protein